MRNILDYELSMEPSNGALEAFVHIILNTRKGQLFALETHPTGTVQEKIIRILMENEVFKAEELRDHRFMVTFKIDTSEESRETMRRYLEYLEL